MLKVHCTLEYHRFGNSQTDTFATGVGNGIYTNPTSFTNPPITQSQFDSIRAEFGTASADYNLYGAVKKTAFSSARKKLINTLDLLADYVDGIANGDESLIILSGFLPSSSIPQSNIPLEKIENFLVKRTANDGELLVDIPAIKGRGSVNYSCICTVGAPLPNAAIVDGQLSISENGNNIKFDFSKGRKKLFKSLTAGVTYYFYVFATNTVSVSTISNPRSIMAT